MERSIDLNGQGRYHGLRANEGIEESMDHKDQEENRPNQVLANKQLGQVSWKPKGNQARVKAKSCVGAEERSPGIQTCEWVSDMRLRITSRALSRDLIRFFRVATRNRGHVFDIDLRSPFGNWSIDVIIVLGKKRSEEKVRLLMSAKANEKNQEEIIMVRDFPEEHARRPEGPKDFVVYCDASEIGLEYTTHNLELGAAVFAHKIWRHYLYGTKSVIYMDHKSLQHIFSQKELYMRQHRWIELFSDYDCEIRYHPGLAFKGHWLAKPDIPYWKWEGIAMICTRHGVADLYHIGSDIRLTQCFDSQSRRHPELVLGHEGSWDVHLLLEAIVKVRWNSKRGSEFTWEREDQMKLKYPHLFSNIMYRVDGGDFMRIMVIYGLL
ncbi:putative reverse transcriptase domain-containing protein [Tanacetum coccineum]|uniref:Reverse transcriptase domain-containing protein n=1 Tax=Tanacetum coccineum TaxID=301880 RepID=A0ABQ5IYH9_9ASTR